MSITNALSRLSPDQRTVLKLGVFGDLTDEQVAAVTGKRVGRVRATRRRGLNAISRDLKDYYRQRLSDDVPG